MPSSSAQRTFVVLDRDIAIKNSRYLLGLVVTDVRRPLDKYEPYSDLGPGWMEPLPFLSDFMVDIRIESSATIKARAVRKGAARIALQGLLGIGWEKASEQSFELRSETIKTFAVEQHDLMFEQLMRLHGDSVKALCQESCARGHVFMVVAFKTAVDATIVRDSGEAAQGNMSLGGGSALGLPIPLSIPMPIPVSHSLVQSWASAMKSIVEGERVFAVEYCEIVLPVTGIITLGTRKVGRPKNGEDDGRLRWEKKVRMKGLVGHGPRVLAFESHEDEDDDEDEEGVLELLV
ncbi:MAG: hypothetical protein M1839_003657 [Geoglossum umbratile]|nr:MAG: hypothetical protein M1839_003657 [Geoglossum umbratile]